MSIIISKDIVAHDFRNSLHGKLEPAKLDTAIRKLTDTATSYPAASSVLGVIFYAKIGVNIIGGKSFDGNAGCLCTPGAGGAAGVLFTDDLAALYANTVSFEFNSLPVYFSVLFFDSSSNLLGHFQSAAISIVTGVGGGQGTWS